jgi:hypothetical protein
MKSPKFRPNRLNLAQKVKFFSLTTLATVGATFLNIEPILAQTVFATKQILNLEMQQGQPQWAQSYMQQVGGARWVFYPNGTFFYAPANARDDLYPLQGTYQSQGNTIFFSGQKSASVGGTGAARAIIDGQMQLINGQPVLQMTSVSGASSGASINEGSYGFNSNAAYQATVLLQQLQ